MYFYLSFLYVYIYNYEYTHINVVIISPDGLLASTEAVQERIGFALSEPIRIAGMCVYTCICISTYICT
jgi:hypothetical protein